jgi:hypothetical protein
MTEFTHKSVNHVPIRLTPERWSHIVTRHPELENHRDRLLETITNPDFVAKGLHGELKAAKLYGDFPMGARYMVVMYREVTHNDGFIITARITSDVGNTIRRGILWQRK